MLAVIVQVVVQVVVQAEMVHIPTMHCPNCPHFARNFLHFNFRFQVIFTMFGFHILFPDHFHMSRGNHETINMNKMYGFDGEVKAKYTGQMCE